jgi:hypothetical protein
MIVPDWFLDRGQGFPRARAVARSLVVWLVAVAGAGWAGAEEPSPSAREEDVGQRLQRLEAQNAALARQNQALLERLGRLSSHYEQLNRRLERIEPVSSGTAPPLPSVAPPEPELPARVGPLSESPGPAVVAGTTSAYWGVAEPSPGVARFSGSPPFQLGGRDEELGAYVLVRPTDAQRVPFELRLDLFTQARFSYFGKTVDFWEDGTGARLPVRNYNSVEITRNFIWFSGFGLDPRLGFSAIIFSSTALNDTVYLGWIHYRFSDAFDLRVGNWIVPGTREWFESFRYTMGSDRLMATTFFRPNISPGIWAQGEPIKNLRYVAMVANSLNRFNQGVERLGSAMTFGGTVWWEPRGDFGPGPSDVEYHEAWTPRIGANLVLSRERNQASTGAGLGNPEDTILRLSDGTPLFRAGALGRGVNLQSTDIQLWTIDAALKRRGFAVSGEYFLRWLDNFRFDRGRSDLTGLFDHGGLLQSGYFLIPRRLEGFARGSFVTGPFGSGGEFGGGLNWYVVGRRDWRFTFEVLRINRSPAQNILTGYRAGESGMLYQLQWFSDF